MTRLGKIRFIHFLPAAVVLALLLPAASSLRSIMARADSGPPVLLDGEDDATKTKGKKPKADAKKEDQKPKQVIRWGQRRNETDEQYDKRYKRLLLQVKQDKRGDISGGVIQDGKGGLARLWTHKGHPFICRSDISREFTADLAMYMEMLHREYGLAYQKVLTVPAQVKEKIEVIVYSDRSTYMANGGTPGSGGFFHPAVHFLNDRGPFWPARHYRLVQFTNGITDFAKWEKGVLKHEAAHMELQLRLGYTLFYGMKIGYPVMCPLWWNEGQATIFEYWDFDKTVDENFADIPNRGRYAPVIRRIYGTDKWKPFHYVWEIDPQTWHEDMTSEQGFLNYAQAWSLAAYMFHGGIEGRKDYRAIFDLSKRVGVDQQTTYQGDRKIAWADKFPAEAQEHLEKNWEAWVSKYVSRDKRVPDEEWFLKRQGYKPEVVDRLEPYSKEEFEKLRKWIEQEQKRRKKAITVEK